MADTIEVHCPHCVKCKEDMEYWRREAIRIAVTKAADEKRLIDMIRHLEYWMGVAAEHAESAYLELTAALETRLHGNRN